MKTHFIDIIEELKSTRFLWEMKLIYMILIAKLISIRCDQINVPKGSSYIKSPNSLRNEDATTNQKRLMKDVCSMLLHLYSPKMKH